LKNFFSEIVSERESFFRRLSWDLKGLFPSLLNLPRFWRGLDFINVAAARSSGATTKKQFSAI
jgi:hypothetical protein